jgi:glucose-like phosphotransferase system IIB component
MGGAPAEAGVRGRAFLAALGGSANLASIGACTTRLRLVVADQALVDEAALKSLGAMGVIRPSDRAVQVIVGPIADQVAEEIRAAGAGAPMGAVAALSSEPAGNTADLPPALVAALGGAGAIREARTLAGRVRVELRDARPVDVATLPGVRGAAQLTPTTLHLLV